jgi:glycosyltransferase involved in cell wall biosynthesis
MRVSCLCVTSPERRPRLAGAVEAYLAQTHASRELVVVLHGSEEQAGEHRQMLTPLAGQGVRLLVAPGAMPLGAVRNVAIDAARGDVLCQWDDDDVHHPSRIQRQLEAMVGGDAKACFLQELLHFFEDPGDLYVENWKNSEHRSHPGTVMVRRESTARYPELGAEASRGEDSVYARALVAEGPVVHLAGRPELFVYVHHGRNTYASSHHMMLATSLGLSRGLLLRRRPEIERWIAEIPSIAARGVRVMGSHGEAFSVRPS